MDEGQLTSRFSVSLGVGRFLDPEHTGAVTLALLGRVDLFTLWVTALIAIGLKQMTSLETRPVLSAAALVWLAIIVAFLMAVAWGAGVLAAVAADAFDWVRAL